MLALQVAATLVASPVADASSAPALRLRCDAGLGFSAAELEQAVLLRMPGGASAENLRVVGGAELGSVEIILGDKRRSVPLGDRRGGLAARWIALTIVDLIAGEAAPPRLPESLPTPAPRSAPRAIWTAFPTIAFGTRSGELLAAGGLGGSLRLYRGLRWTVDVDYGRAPDKAVGDVAITMQELSVHSGPAFRFERAPIELRLSAVVAPYWVHASSGQKTAEHQSVVGGVSAAGFAYLPIYRPLLALLAVGVDLFVNQTEFLAGGQSVYTTPRFTVWLGAGLALRSS